MSVTTWSHPRRGQALPLVAVMVPLFLSVVGLAIDGGLVLAARRELQNTADAAARAGAMQVDVRAYRASNGIQVVLNRNEARRAVEHYIVGRSARLTELTIASERVSVRVSRDVRLSFLSVVGLDSARIDGEAVAAVRHGIERAQP